MKSARANHPTTENLPAGEPEWRNEVSLPRQATEAIEKAQQDRFWGTVELRFQDGRLRFVVTTKTVAIKDKENPYESEAHQSTSR